MVNLFESPGFSLPLNEAFVFNYYNDVTSPFVIREHFHDVYEMLLFIRGDCEYSVEGNIYAMNPLDLIFTNTRELHMPLFLSNAHYERINILIKPSFLSAFVTDSYNPLALFENRPLGKQNKIEGKIVKKFGIDAYFIQIKEALTANNQYTEILLKTLLVQMLIKIETILELTKTSYTNNEKVSAIMRYIADNLDKDLDYDTLASLIFVSKNYLYRLFKQQTGFTLPEYVKHKRVGKAKEMLLDGMNSMDAAQQLGFKDYSVFFRTFKSITGVAPSEFIK